MNIDDLFKMYEQDMKFNILNLAETLIERPKLHAKYMKLYMQQSFKLKKKEIDLAQFIKFKTNYYMGKLDDDQLERFGWEPYRLKILKSDLPTYLASDKEINEKKLVIELLQQNVKTLEEMVKQIGYRGQDIKALMDYERFKAGG